MKAIRCHGFGPVEGISLDDIPVPVAGPNQVVVTVKAAGVNFPDALMVEGKYQAKPGLPFTPGCEFAGIVSVSGPCVTHVKAGELKPPVSARYALARAGDALAALTRREVTGKVVIVP